MSHIFDLDSSRKELQRQISDLKNELGSNEKLQAKFESVSTMLQQQASEQQS
jgi:hypothetical protein